MQLQCALHAGVGAAGRGAGTTSIYGQKLASTSWTTRASRFHPFVGQLASTERRRSAERSIAGRARPPKKRPLSRSTARLRDRSVEEKWKMPPFWFLPGSLSQIIADAGSLCLSRLFGHACASGSHGGRSPESIPALSAPQTEEARASTSGPMCVRACRARRPRKQGGRICGVSAAAGFALARARLLSGGENGERAIPPIPFA